jgi:predicted branched-subunit amino acid permease
MADEIWAVAEREALARPLTPAFYFGSGVFLWCNWLFFCGLGAMLGAALSEPERYALDFAFPAIFIGLAAAFWRGWRTAPVVLASAATAVVAAKLLPGAWYVILGALAGILAGAVLPGEREGAR